MLASPTALKDYLFADSEAEYQLEHNVPVDISRRELSAPAGARYLRKPDENEDRPHGAVGPRAFVMPLDVDQMNLGPRFSARTRFRLPNTWTRKIRVLPLHHGGMAENLAVTAKCLLCHMSPTPRVSTCRTNKKRCLRCTKSVMRTLNNGTRFTYIVSYPTNMRKVR